MDWLIKILVCVAVSESIVKFVFFFFVLQWYVLNALYSDRNAKYMIIRYYIVLPEYYLHENQQFS